ncbi:hypothetical protein HYN59_03930 [Flavobacterium album]|uniref:HTH araC/xylS-type domain-containing protein n=1 Tax=Flavobacterium album TaxID=2175091 RepID=A0A2S1QVA6_9FLAO|nr:AraC family transcriptional regulator [Flavobacterium album]AWH84315.1 hypothetical protein HYN59_03930 [Flavobacterium album]
MNISYREIQPSPELQSYVDCYWMQTFTETAGELSPIQRCLPFGTVELIAHLDDNRCEVLFDGIWHKLPQVFLAGLYRDTVLWRSPGDSRKFGIRLKPEALYSLFKMPASALYNDYTSIDNIGLRQAVSFTDTLIGLATPDQIVARVEAYLKEQLLKNQRESNYFIEAANLMRKAKGGISVEEVSSRLAVSPRQLQRVFRDQVGTSPKTFGRIIRFSNAFKEMQNLEEAGGWAGLSYLLGYSDQAHFIREFKEFSGVIPNLMLHDEGMVFRKTGIAI